MLDYPLFERKRRGKESSYNFIRKQLNVRRVAVALAKRKCNSLIRINWDEIE
jgi:hypothetical protein